MIAALIPPRRAWDGDAVPQGSRLASGAALLIMLLLRLALWACIFGLLSLALWTCIYGLIGLVMGIA